jgi:hypothetical protein
MTELNPPAPNERSKKAAWSVIPIAVTAISVVGFLAGAALYPLDYDEGGVWDDIFFAMLALGWMAALVTGLFAWIMGRRSGNAQVTRSGVIALTWFGLVLIIEGIHQAVG